MANVTVRTAEVSRRIGESQRLHLPLAESRTTKRYTKLQRGCVESRSSIVDLERLVRKIEAGLITNLIMLLIGSMHVSAQVIVATIFK